MKNDSFDIFIKIFFYTIAFIAFVACVSTEYSVQENKKSANPIATTSSDTTIVFDASTQQQINNGVDNNTVAQDKNDNIFSSELVASDKNFYVYIVTDSEYNAEYILVALYSDDLTRQTILRIDQDENKYYGGENHHNFTLESKNVLDSGDIVYVLIDNDTEVEYIITYYRNEDIYLSKAPNIDLGGLTITYRVKDSSSLN